MRDSLSIAGKSKGIFAAVCLVTFTITITALAQDSAPEPVEPVLLVRATSKRANQGDFALNLDVVEQHFIEKLRSERVENVVPSSTTHIPSPAHPLLALSVGARRQR